MAVGEVVYLCMVVAAVAFGIGYGVAYLIDSLKCKHHFEEVLKSERCDKDIVVHMCKKCGKRKITKV